MFEIGQRRVAQLGLVKHDEVIVQHADARHAGRSQRPSGIQARLAGQHQRLIGIGIAFQHVGDDDLVHAVPDVLHLLRHLRAPHRAAQRIENALRSVVDNRTIEFVAMAQRLAIQQQAFRVLQQAVVVHQVVEVFGTVEKFVWLHALRHFKRNGAK